MGNLLQLGIPDARERLLTLLHDHDASQVRKWTYWLFIIIYNNLFLGALLGRS
jgi:hypothetical protein